MAVAGTLAVNIIARTNQFQKGINKARAGLSGFSKSVRTSELLTSKFNTILGAVSAGGLVAMGIRSIETAAELGNVADKLGIATEKLELMRFAAEQTGVSTQTLDMALQRMVRRVGQAAQGTGEAAGTLEAMGLNAQELNRLDPAAQFERISEAVQGIPDRGGQLAAMQKIFDSEGVGLINLAAEGVERYADAFERAGGATEGIRSAQEFALALNELRGAAKALTRDITTEMVPVLQDAMGGLRVLIEDATGGAGRGKKSTPLSQRLRIPGRALGEFAYNFFQPIDASRYRLLGAQGQTMGQFQTTIALEESTRIQREQLEIMRQQQTSPEAGGVTIEPATFN